MSDIYSDGEDYDDDDYEFEDFDDSENEDQDNEEFVITDQAHHDTDEEKVHIDGSLEGSFSADLDLTQQHNQQVMASLKLSEPSEKSLSENNSSDDMNGDINKNMNNEAGNDNNVGKLNDEENIDKDVGANTLVHSISAELRQMMLDEERQNKENICDGSPAQPESKVNNIPPKKRVKKTGNRVRSPVNFELLPGEEGLTDHSSTLIAGGTFTSNMSSIEASGTAPSPSKVFNGPGSDAWKSQLDSYSSAMGKCIENEKKRSKGSRFIQSHVSHDAKHHRSIIERQLRCALQQVNSYRKENSYLTKMIDTSSIHSDFNALQAKNEEQRLLIKQLVDEKRALLLVQRNQEKSLLETEKEKASLPEKEHIAQKKMNMFQKKVKTLRDNLYHYQVKSREEMTKSKHLANQNTKLKVKLKALMITHSVAEQLKRDQLGLKDSQDQDKDYDQSIQSKFESVGVGEESMVRAEESTERAEKEDSVEELTSQRNRLKSIVENQRVSFRNQLVVLQSKLERSLGKRKELEDELVRREKEMRAQICTVKDLNKMCEELTKSNMELLEASSLYSKKTRRTVQSGTHVRPVPPAPTQPFVHRPSPVMSRPKEPIMAENTFLTGQSFGDSAAEEQV